MPSSPENLSSGRAGWRRVRLLGIPVDVFRRAIAYQEELERECALVVMRPDQSASGAEVARSLLRVASALRRDERAVEPENDLEAAEARGDPVIDIDLALPTNLASRITEFQGILDAAADLCGHGQMLTIEPTPEVSVFRRWFLAEIVGQLADSEPTPWGGLSPVR